MVKGAILMWMPYNFYFIPIARHISATTRSKESICSLVLPGQGKWNTLLCLIVGRVQNGRRSSKNFVIFWTQNHNYFMSSKFHQHKARAIFLGDRTRNHQVMSQKSSPLSHSGWATTWPSRTRQ